MPFCTHCGAGIGERDAFCAGCGTRQSAGASGPDNVLGGLNPRTAALLCYVPMVGWIASIIVLASERFRHDRDTRFHAFQGLYLSVAWLMVDWVVGPMARGLRMGFGIFGIVSALKAVLVVAWIFMLVKVSQNEFFKLPFLGDLAEKSVAEQR